MPGQTSQAKLDAEQTAAMIRFAVRKPPVNAKDINEDGPARVGLVGSANQDLVSSDSPPSSISSNAPRLDLV